MVGPRSPLSAQDESHQHWIQWDNHLFCPAGDALSDVPQNVGSITPGPPGHTLLTHTEMLLTSTHRSLSAGLFSRKFSSSLYLCPTLLHPRCRIWHLGLSKFIPLTTAKSTNLSSCHCKASCPSRETTAPLTLASSENLLKVHSTPSSRSLINRSNGIGPRIAPEEHHWWPVTSQM